MLRKKKTPRNLIMINESMVNLSIPEFARKICQ